MPPLQIGVYEENRLIKSFISKDKTSEALPSLFEKILQNYDVKSIIYAKGPGSFMAIKIAYIFLKSISIVKNIPLLGADSFIFNQNNPIKALGNLHFIKENGIIRTQKIKSNKESSLKLPQFLDKKIFSLDSKPLYILPAV